MFEIHLTPIVITLAAVLLAATLCLLFGFRHYVASVAARVRDDSRRPMPDDGYEWPAVSVIVYSEDDAPNLEVLLPQILDQDYPAHFEVIVVNDGAVSSTKDVIARLEKRYSNLYMTFTPLESRSLSRKKLALTLGIKAARFDVVVHTTGCCQVPSRLWLKSICRNFTPGTDIVIGYSAPAVPDGIREPRKRLHAFDTVRTAVEYLSWAIAGRPYRGNCCNLAYRRSLFFNNKGFSRTLHLKYGDDDLFINEVATPRNTDVELSADSLILNVENTPAASHRTSKLRYDYTGSRLRTRSRLFFKACSTIWWLQIASAIWLAVAGLPSLIPLIAAALMLLLTWIVLMFTWRRTSRALWSRSILLTFPWFMSIHPVYTLIYKIKGFRKRGNNLTWS